MEIRVGGAELKHSNRRTGWKADGETLWQIWSK